MSTYSNKLVTVAAKLFEQFDNTHEITHNIIKETISIYWLVEM